MSCSNNTTIIRKDPNTLNCGPNCGGNLSFDADCKPTLRPKREAIIQQIKEYCLLMLGAPVIDIELDDQQIEAAIRQVLRIIEEYSGKDKFQYMTFMTVPGKSVYEIPDCGYIRSVSYRQNSELTFEATELGGQIPLEYQMGLSGTNGNYGNGFIDPSQPIWGGMGNWVNYKGYSRLYASLSSSLGSWEWVSDYKHIKLYPIPFRRYAVVVHYIQKCKDWELMSQAMTDGCLASLKMVLGRIRSKYTNIPGPNGGIQLDGAALLAEGREDYMKWQEDLIYKFGDIYGPTYG